MENKIISTQTLIEKIIQKYTVGIQKGEIVQSGDFVSIKPSYVMTHDNTAPVMQKFKTIGVRKFKNPRQVVFTIDHDIQNKSEANLNKYTNIEAFGKEMGVDFYPAGRGIGHQIICEEGYAWPGTMVVASDSHSNMYGGLGCLGTPVVRTDAAAIWATGRTWWQVPPIARVELKGKLKPGVSGKDVIVTLCGLFNKDEVLNHVIEFIGDGISYLNIDQRLTIANMTTEWGALAGVFPVDNVTIQWLLNRGEYIKNRGLAGVFSDADGNGEHPRLNSDRIDKLNSELTALQPDKDAYYVKELTLSLETVRPYVSGPNHVKVMNSVTAMEKQNIKIDKAYLVSCVNSRLDDITEAANVVRGKKIDPEVEFYIAAASSEVQAESEKQGDWQALVTAGAKPLPAGCGPCIGLGVGLLEDGEVGISATNRNFKGRMGSSDAAAYLSSPAVVAASAIAGKIASHIQFDETKPVGTITNIPKPENGVRKVVLLPEFSKVIEGKIIFCPQDNLNTDGIFPSKYTYIDDFTPEQQAEVVMENYDPEFSRIVKTGDILVGCFNFGTGSSREQAATALKYRGIQSVLAGSFSQTYKRNAFNNGFLLLEVPELVLDLKKQFGSDELTIRTNLTGEIDFSRSKLTVGEKYYTIGPVGTAAQELIIKGGLENWVREKIQ